MARYSSGDWFGIVTPAGMALLPGGVTVETLERVWTAMHAGKGLGAVIEGLVGAFGTSLSRLPDFAVLALGPDGVKVAVRGAVEATLQVTGAAEPLSISGAGVTTWNERAATGVAAATLAVPGAAAGSELPLADGIVHAEALHWILIETEAEPPVAQPAPPPAVPPPPLVEPVAVVVPEPAPVEAVVPPLPPVPPAPAVPVVAPPPPPAPPRAAETTLIEKITEVTPSPYDQLLFGETVLSSVEDAAVREAEPEATVGPPAAPLLPPPPPAPPGDHDGETVLVDQLRLLQAAAAATAAAPAQPARRPPVLRLPSASPVVLDRSAIIGTRPRLARVQPGNVPHLIPVNSPSSEISRSHLELRVEGLSVLAVDLNSTNGTLLLRAGAEPVRLQPHEPSLLVPGDRVDLGDGIVLEFEGLQ